MFNSSPENRQQLIEIYQKQTTINQEIIQLLSVIYEPITRTSFLECFQLTGNLDEQGKSYNIKTLKPQIDRFLKLRLLAEDGNKKIICHPLIVEIATRDSINQNNFEKFANIVEEKIPISTRSWGEKLRYFSSEIQLIREIRLGIYRQDLEFIQQQIEAYKAQSYTTDDFDWGKIIALVLDNPFDPEWFSLLPFSLYESSLMIIIRSELINLNPVDEYFDLLKKTCAGQIKEYSDILQFTLVEQLIVRNEIEEAEKQLKLLKNPEEYIVNIEVFTGLINFVKGDYQLAINHFNLAIKVLKKITKKRKIYFDHFGGMFFILALIKENTSESIKLAKEYLNIISNQPEKFFANINAYGYFDQIIWLLEGDLSVQKYWEKTILPATYTMESLLTYFCCYWLNPEVAKNRLPKLLENLLNQTFNAGYYWLAWEVGQLLLRLEPGSNWRQKINQITPQKDSIPLADFLQFEEPWQLSLNALINLNIEPEKSANTPEKAKRLVWFLSLSDSNWTLTPKEQVVNKKGVWSDGRILSLKKLKTTPGSFDYLTHQDLKVCSTINIEEGGYYDKTEYFFGDETIVELIGHPLVFWENSPNSRVEIVKAQPELLIKKAGKNQLILELSPPLYQVDDILVWEETPTRVKVLTVTSEYERIAKILGANNQLKVPISAQDKVLKAINTVSSLLTVHSDIGGTIANTEEIQALVIPHIQLLPMGLGLKVGIFACPFGQGGSYYRPGSGGATVIAEIEGKRYQTTRDLAKEKELANVIIAGCPVLNTQNSHAGEWQFDDPEDCLELLLQLQELKDQVILEWPEGQSFKLAGQASFANLSLKIKGENDWFQTTGELQLDENLVLELQQLLELLDQSQGRFIPLGDNKFLALTASFRKRLEELNMFSEKQGKGRKIHGLSALALQDFFDDVEHLKADTKWKNHCKKIQEMKDFIPELPSTFQGELRDYQLEGFNWLSRLSYWGVGACLADDMGLGKTIQALAVILTRASEGATLIVAPTSVCFNWINEAAKFAPTLNPMLFGSGNRQEILANLQPFDLLICSYGLLQQEQVAQMLAEIKWSTIVLDEAQFIKNMATKRSQAAMDLQGSFKLITTGTPIENHLGELWNLFRFINPGLLGSLQSFNQRFINGIESSENHARQQLKRLIQPFILRRTKNQVLQELPPRTETILYVELSQEEMALYETLRRDAVSQLTESSDPGGQKHLQVLAALMKLRRCCCNPRLVMADSRLNSSKLALFGEVIEELRENRHKTLVFSQFVDHLQIVKNYLDQAKISYQYLDGSTPIKERQERVQAFQAGEGDVFLISLKAGGTGLNLTAADYVIHLDPWWNPAVEDQASDRVYRMGQKRPVTVYRLVAKDTIEEKIVELHHQKRDLADSLLSGADVSGKMKTEELLELIK
jgi:superfamily II DNA or RNA helicase